MRWVAESDLGIDLNDFLFSCFHQFIRLFKTFLDKPFSGVRSLIVSVSALRFGRQIFREDLASRDDRISRLTSRIEELAVKLADAQNQTAVNCSKLFSRTSEQAALLNRRSRRDRERDKDDFDGNPPADDTGATEPSPLNHNDRVV